MEDGVQCVMMVSVLLTLQLLADNLVMQLTIDMEMFEPLGKNLNPLSVIFTDEFVYFYHTCSYSQGNGTILLDNINCYTSSNRLSQCSHRGWGVTLSCSHSEDVALQCSTVTITPPNTTISEYSFLEFSYMFILLYHFLLIAISVTTL